MFPRVVRTEVAVGLLTGPLLSRVLPWGPSTSCAAAESGPGACVLGGGRTSTLFGRPQSFNSTEKIRGDLEVQGPQIHLVGPESHSVFSGKDGTLPLLLLRHSEDAPFPRPNGRPTTDAPWICVFQDLLRNGDTSEFIASDRDCQVGPGPVVQGPVSSNRVLPVPVPRKVPVPWDPCRLWRVLP